MIFLLRVNAVTQLEEMTMSTMMNVLKIAGAGVVATTATAAFVFTAMTVSRLKSEPEVKSYTNSKLN